MTHPLDGAGPRALLPLAVATVLVMLALGWLGRPLQTAAAPTGVVAFELARTPAAAAAILASWDGPTRLYAAANIGLDYLFLCLYSTSLALLCLRVARRRGPWLRRAAPLVAWLQWLAALCDAVENGALLAILLSGDPRAALTTTAWACAVVKFALVALAVAFLLTGALAAARARLTLYARRG